MSIADVLSGAKRWHVERGDCLDVLDSIPAASLDAAILDPPAGIGFMGKEWDDFRRARNPADVGRDSIGGRLSRCAPEMGRRDRDQFVAWLAERLSKVRRVLKPGAALLCWAMPRTSGWTHRAIEDAGFDFDPVGFVVHAFGQGWNKSPDQLKPAVEPWYFARAPLSERTIAANRERWGLPYLGVDDCRVGTNKRAPGSPPKADAKVYRDGPATVRNPEGDWNNPNIGRRPSAFVLSHVEGCRLAGTKRVTTSNWKEDDRGRETQSFRRDGVVKRSAAPMSYGDADGIEEVDAWICADGCPVRLLDEQSGERPSGAMKAGTLRSRRAHAYADSSGGALPEDIEASTGTASRFFAQFPPEPFTYAAKTASSERHAGCDALLWAVDAGRPSGVRLVTQAEWSALPEAERRRGNVHPTVKSLALMRHFVRLVCPPGGVVLDCFAGSGGTVVGALYEGRRAVAIEQDPDYAMIACARAAFAARNVGRAFKAPRTQPAPVGQLDLLGGAA